MRRDDLDAAVLASAYESGESAASLARQFHANIWAVLARLRQAGVAVRSSAAQNEQHVGLAPSATPMFLGVVDGLLLGDGWVDFKGCLRLEQAHTRYGWLVHVAEHLRLLGVASRIVPVPARERLYEERVIRSGGGGLLYTPCYQEMKEQRVRWYPRGRKRVPRDVELTPLGVAYWLCGDGSYDAQGALFFYTNGFLKREVGELAEKLCALGVRSRRVPVGRAGEYKIAITERDAAQRLKELVWEHVPECCRYKLQHVRPATPRGAAQARLTQLQAEEIRRRYFSGGAQVVLAQEYKVTQATISRVVRGEVHKGCPKTPFGG